MKHFSDHNAMRLDINYREKTVKKKPTKTWRLNNTFINNEQATEEIKEGNKSIYFLSFVRNK